VITTAVTLTANTAVDTTTIHAGVDAGVLTAAVT
jgi:hypothetical protein